MRAYSSALAAAIMPRLSLSSFQYRRKSAPAPSYEPDAKQSQRLQPLRDATNTKVPEDSGGATASVLAKRPSSSRAPPAKKPRKSKRAEQGLLYQSIGTELAEEERLKQLVERIMDNEYKTNYSDVDAAEREKFEEAMLQVSDFLQKHVSEMAESDESVSRRTRENPKNVELQKREILLAEVIKNYEAELGGWENAKSACREMNQDELGELPDKMEGDLSGFPKPDDVFSSSARAVESYVLQTDHMLHMLKNLEYRNKKTYSRVHAIAVALNERVRKEFGADTTGNLAAPESLVNARVDEGS